MSVYRLFPKEFHPVLVAMGRVPWLRVWIGENEDPVSLIDPVPRTSAMIAWEAFDRIADPRLRESARRIARMTLEPGSGPFVIDAAAAVLTDGPKLFRPTAEQFESMQHVELHLPAADFRSPYPGLIIEVPMVVRQATARLHGLNVADLGDQITVRHRAEPGEPRTTVIITPMPGTKSEEVYVFTESRMNADIEIILTSVLDGNRLTSLDALPPRVRAEKLASCSWARAALNLCLMLTNHGHRLAGPCDPAAYAKHRAKRHLEHLKHGDCLAVELVQEVIVRRVLPPTDNPPGPGTGTELTPHWRKGYWRSYPGQGAKRAAGETVPLLFVRPCLVRADRLVGDVSETQTTYHS